MPFVTLSTTEGTDFEKLLGHAPQILKQWNQLEHAFFQSSTFDANFLEQVRRALAFKNQCQYCMKKAGPPSAESYHDMRLKVALSFANHFAIDHLGIGKAEVDELKHYFTNVEIVELIAFCSFISASQRFGAVLGLGESM